MTRGNTGVMLNIDINSVVTPFLTETAKKEKVTEKDLFPFVDVYAGTQITDVLFCTFCQYSLTPSCVFGDTEFKYSQTMENGIPVNYHQEYEGIHTMLTKFGIDPVKVWLKRTREIGLRSWVSIRMNDCHCPEQETCFLRSDFFYEARERGWMIGDAYGYYRYCFNYAIPEVRQKMLDYLEEQLARYDMDGLELDFEREIHCFDYLNCPNAVEIMTTFVADVKALITVNEARLGHPIELSIRLGRDMEQNRVFGFDVKRLVDVGVQRIIVTPRWATSDSDMPIDTWCRELPNTSITAGIEFLINRQRDESCGTPDVVRAYAAHYLEEGSDGIYLFNYFLNPYDRGSAGFNNHHDIHTSCFGPTVTQEERLFIVTYQDIAPEGYPAWHPLPVTLGDRPWTYLFRPGVVPLKRMEIVVGLDKENVFDLQLMVDGNPVRAIRRGGKGQVFAPDNTLLSTFTVPQAVFTKKKEFVLSFASNQPMRLTFLAVDCQ